MTDENPDPVHLGSCAAANKDPDWPMRPNQPKCRTRGLLILLL